MNCESRTLLYDYVVASLFAENRFPLFPAMLPLALTSQDAGEGAAAFTEKRQSNWQGKQPVRL